MKTKRKEFHGVSRRGFIKRTALLTGMSSLAVEGLLLEGCQTWSEKTSILLFIPESDANPFGQYLAEILVSEGLRNFETVTDSAELSLASYALVMMTEAKLSPKQAQQLAGYVQNGGHLIAFRPDDSLTRRLGVETSPETTIDGYWKLEDRTNPLTPRSLQFKGSAPHWTPGAGAETVARLYESPSKPLSHPAILRVRFGHGQALLFAFDPVLTVVYLRQGKSRESEPGDRWC